MFLHLSLAPIMNYLHQHPHAGFIVAFLVSFLESLPIIGAVIPGSVTMTAMGTMVGSLVLPAYSTFGWAILGALAGDSLSYLAGYRYHKQLNNMWPLKRYPKLFEFGERFFKKHGGKSIVIGRFVGPMRSAIPMVAGIMQMTRTRFFVSAIPSAIMWAIAYMLPGVMIGAISQELPPGKATEFILGFILLLVVCWLLTWLAKLSISHIMKASNRLMCIAWDGLKKNRLTHDLTLWLQQYENPREHKPLNYFLTSMGAWILFFILLYNTLNNGPLSHWNVPLFYLLQSIHGHLLTNICIWITLLAQKPVILTMSALLWLWLFFQGYRRSAWYWLGLVLSTAIMVGVFKFLFHHARPGGLQYVADSSSFPSGHATLAISLFGFITYLFIHQVPGRVWHSIQYTLAVIMILLIGFSRLYLGAHWLLDVVAGFCLGAGILFLVVILYRRFACERIPAKRLSIVVGLSLIIPWIAYGSLQLKKQQAAYLAVWPTPTLSKNQWWMSPTEKLPIYRLSRLGQPSQPFNIQWAGSLDQMTPILKHHGWQRHHHEEQLKSMVERLITLQPSKHMPLFPPLFHGNPPAVVFIKALANKNIILELRLWDSGGRLTEESSQSGNRPSDKASEKIWLGNISYHRAGKKIIALHEKYRSHYEILNALQYIESMVTPPDTSKIISTSVAEQPKSVRHLDWDGRIIVIQSQGNKNSILQTK